MRKRKNSPVNLIARNSTKKEKNIRNVYFMSSNPKLSIYKNETKKILTLPICELYFERLSFHPEHSNLKSPQPLIPNLYKNKQKRENPRIHIAEELTAGRIPLAAEIFSIR